LQHVGTFVEEILKKRKINVEKNPEKEKIKC
jgi:hypothetical protein